MNRWTGRFALVTGASVGIGAAISKKLVKEGLVVIGCARNEEKIQESANEMEGKFPGELHAIKCDLTSETDIIKMFEEIRRNFGRLDVCINNAGVCRNSPLLKGDTSDWKNMLELNILALCMCTREAVKLMREKEVEEGQIIHISSIGGHKLPYTPMHGFNFYCGTKSMVRALAEGLRQEVIAGNSRKNLIRVASVSPGLTRTGSMSRYLSPDTARLVYENTPSLSTNDVADAVTYILQSPPTVNVNDVLLDSLEIKETENEFYLDNTQTLTL